MSNDIEKAQPRVHTLEIDGITYPIGYKVVTSGSESLGLRQNPNILTYPVGEWFELPEEDIKEGSDDWGGIWVARIPSKAQELVRYMKEQYGVECVVYLAVLGDILFCNNGRVKTNKVFLLPSNF